MSKGVRIEIGEEGTVRIEIGFLALFGHNICDVAKQVQQHVKKVRRRRNARLAQELQEARARLAQWEETSQEARQRRVCQELERVRDSLIGDIKALRRFRESFRQAVEEDAQSLLRRAESLPSEKLL